MIKRIENGKWQVQSHTGKPMGTYDTEGEAKTRLQQIEIFKSLKGKNNKKKRKKKAENFYSEVLNILFG